MVFGDFAELLDTTNVETRSLSLGFGAERVAERFGFGDVRALRGWWWWMSEPDRDEVNRPVLTHSALTTLPFLL